MKYATGLLAVGLVCALTAAAHAIMSAPEPPGLTIETDLLITTAGPPANYVTPATDYTGVVNIFTNNVRGTGTLISGENGDFILTAAHLLDVMAIGQTQIKFDLPGGAVYMTAAEFIRHPTWAGQYTLGYDIALIRLNGPAPATADRYTLYWDDDEVGQVGDKVGYGRSGTGTQGVTGGSGTKRDGENLYDALGEVFYDTYGDNGLPTPLFGSQLVYDFDNGQAANDALGLFFGLGNTGVGAGEVAATFGDSGGPTFINGQIAGITSYGLRLTSQDGTSSDIDALLNSSFGEFVVDTRVSYYAQWIDSKVLFESGTPTSGAIPEPVTLAGAMMGLLMLGRYAAGRKG